MTPAVLVHALTKKFYRTGWFSRSSSSTIAVDNFNFSIEAGAAVAFLGRNGAGKSTLIKLLCGILTPTSGYCTLFGHASGSLVANRQLGLVLGSRSQLWTHLTLQQNLTINAEIYGITGKAKKQRITELVDILAIDDLLDQRARTLSLGQRMRCELAMALIHHPKIVLADEPTVGLDVVAKEQFRSMMINWRQTNNMTLLLTSHDCSDIERLCDRTLLIDRGSLQYDGSLSGLKGDLSSIRTIKVLLAKKQQNLSWNHPAILLQHLDEHHLHFKVNIAQLSIMEALHTISERIGDNIVDIQIAEVTLEEVIQRLFNPGAANGG